MGRLRSGMHDCMRTFHYFCDLFVADIDLVVLKPISFDCLFNIYFCVSIAAKYFSAQVIVHADDFPTVTGK